MGSGLFFAYVTGHLINGIGSGLVGLSLARRNGRPGAVGLLPPLLLPWVGLLVPLAMLRKGTFKPGNGGRGARGLLTLVLIGVGAALSLVSLGYDWGGADADMEGQKASIGLGMGDTTFGSTLVVLFAVSTLALAIGYYLHGGLRYAAPMVASATLYGSIMAMSLIAAIGLDDLGRTTGNLTAGHAHAEVEVFSGTWIAAASAVACLLGAYWAAYSNGRGVQSVSGGAALKRTAIENVSPTPPNAGSGDVAPPSEHGRWEIEGW